MGETALLKVLETFSFSTYFQKLLLISVFSVHIHSHSQNEGQCSVAILHARAGHSYLASACSQPK